jgi:hypothetical protein
MARVGLGRLEYLMERMDRNIDLEGSDITVNSLTSDTGVTVTAGGLGVTAGGVSVTAGGLGITAGGATVTAGDVGITAGNLALATGSAYFRGEGGFKTHQVAPEALTAHQHAVTAAMMKKGILTCAATGSHSKPTENGTQITSGLGLVEIGDSFDFSLINTATTGGHNVTLLDSATGVTIVGNPIVAARDDTDDAISVGVGRFRVRKTNTNVVVIYRIG